METAVLTRKKFSPREEVVLTNRSLLDRARSVLGYEARILSAEQSLIESRKAELEVQSALVSAEIEPLDTGSVERYKAAKTKEAESKGSCGFVKAMHKDRGEAVVVVVGIPAFVSLVGSGIAFGVMSDAHTLAHHPYFLKIAPVWVAVIFGTWIVCMIARHKQATLFTAKWSAQYIQRYTHEIPNFALERALQLKTALPDAQFYVEELQESSHGLQTEHRPAPDPFLVMEYKQVRIYLDVWNEPSFEGRRVV